MSTDHRVETAAVRRRQYLDDTVGQFDRPGIEFVVDRALGRRVTVPLTRTTYSLRTSTSLDDCLDDARVVADVEEG